MKILLVLALAVCYSEAQKDPHWVDGRQTIVHLFEWKWTDIGDECERFLSQKKYAGVQISPPNENLVISSSNRPWWERYQPMSYILTTRSGDENDFLDMTTRCNAVGIRIYADVVFNHMTGTWENDQSGTAGSTADTAAKNYPAVPYDSSHFHETCVLNDYNSATMIRNCELTGLHDLDQSQEHVREEIIEYLNHLIKLGVAGFRVDAAKHMDPVDLEYIYSSLDNLNTEFGFEEGARPYIYQEVIDLGSGDAVTADEYTGIGIVTEMKYSNHVSRTFRGYEPLQRLSDWGPSWGFMDSENAIVFVENHDSERGHGAGGADILSYKVTKAYKQAIAFMLAHPYGAATKVMSSFEFEDTEAGPPHDEDYNILSPTINDDGSCGNGWVCQHRWSQIYNMVEFRSLAEGTEIQEFWSDGYKQISFCRGNKGFIALTKEGDLQQTLQTCMEAGTYCDVISGNVQDGACTGKTVTVGSDGTASIEIKIEDEEGVLAIHVNSKV